MDKAEQSELKKQFKDPEDCVITRIAGRYIDPEGRILAEFSDDFLSLPENDRHKYLAIFRRGLAGRLGKNGMDADFKPESDTPGTIRSSLIRLRAEGLDQGETLERIYSAMAHYHLEAGSLFLFAEGNYDIPVKASDGKILEDSEDVYHFILGSICPVARGKDGLCYNPSEKGFEVRIPERMVGMPECMFLYPDFTDRAPDADSVYYYMRKPSDPLFYAFGEDVETGLGVNLLPTEEEQRTDWESFVTNSFEEPTFDKLKELHEKMTESEEDVLDEVDARGILRECGADQEAEMNGTVNKSLVTPSKMKIESEDLSMSVNNESVDLIEERIIDGRACLVIPITNEMRLDGVLISVKNALAGKDTGNQ